MQVEDPEDSEGAEDVKKRFSLAIEDSGEAQDSEKLKNQKKQKERKNQRNKDQEKTIHKKLQKINSR